MSEAERGYFNQAGAADYLGVSVRYFREHVDVEPVPWPGRGESPHFMYPRADLDAWALSWRKQRAS
jgi:hypothetical protein